MKKEKKMLDLFQVEELEKRYEMLRWRVVVDICTGADCTAPK